MMPIPAYPKTFLCAFIWLWWLPGGMATAADPAPALSDTIGYISTLLSQTQTLRQAWQLDSSLTLGCRALDLAQRGGNVPDSLLVCTYYAVAQVYMAKSDFNRSDSLLRKALDVDRQAAHPSDSMRGTILTLLGSVSMQQGEYDESERLLRQALAVFTRTYGPDAPQSMTTLELLAVNLGEQVKYAEAESLAVKMIAIREKSAGPDDLTLGQTLMRLAPVFTGQSKAETASGMYARAMRIFKLILGPDHPQVAYCLGWLATLNYDIGNSAFADSCYREAVALLSKKSMPEDVMTGYTLQLLAYRNWCAGQLPEAESLCTRAVNMLEKFLGPRHPNVGRCRLLSAYICLASGDYDGSLTAYRKFLAGQLSFIEYAFSFSSETQKLRWINRAPVMDHGLLTLAASGKAAGAKPLAMEMILREKAIVSDAVMAEKSTAYCSDDTAITSMLARRADICTLIANMSTTGLEGNAAPLAGDNIQRLFLAQDSLETELSGRCAAFGDKLGAHRFTVADVAAGLPQDAVLCEFVVCFPFDLSQRDCRIVNYFPPRYLAFVLDRAGAIDVVDLGSAEVIDSLVRRARESIYAAEAMIFSPLAADLETQLKEITAPLYERLFAPLVPHFHGRTTILLSPYGYLGLLPFEILPQPNGSYLIEEYRLSYLSAGRELLRFRDSTTAAGAAVLMADPDFNAGESKDSTLGQTAAGSKSPVTTSPAPEPMRGAVSCLDRAFTPLQYGRSETMEIARILKNIGREPVREFYGSAAREDVLKQLDQPPRILHLVTHGFFCPSPDDEETSATANSLLQSGLVLAGANRAIAGGDPGVAAEDGILTAYEVSGLNLTGTELATLSACESGLGEVGRGEGIFGLRRAFRHAGAKAIVMSLWKVPDKETADLMKGFYRRWLNGITKRDALRESALEVLRRCRREKGHGHPLLWGGFVLTGNPY